nr:retrotransposon protein, putative, Ty1-copia subclass [Tanacetum cinerariifolium]
MGKVSYASTIGSIMYVMTCIRPDVSYALSMTSRYQKDHGEKHWIVMKNIPRYLRRTKDMFLVYEGLDDEFGVKGYTDASFQTNRDDTKSQSGYLFIMNDGVVAWRCLKQDTIAMSSTKSEYIVVSEVTQVAYWMKKFIEELGLVPSIKNPVKKRMNALYKKAVDIFFAYIIISVKLSK